MRRTPDQTLPANSPARRPHSGRHGHRRAADCAASDPTPRQFTGRPSPTGSPEHESPAPPRRDFHPRRRAQPPRGAPRPPSPRVRPTPRSAHTPSFPGACRARPSDASVLGPGLRAPRPYRRQQRFRVRPRQPRRVRPRRPLRQRQCRVRPLRRPCPVRRPRRPSKTSALRPSPSSRFPRRACSPRPDPASHPSSRPSRWDCSQPAGSLFSPFEGEDPGTAKCGTRRGGPSAGARQAARRGPSPLVRVAVMADDRDQGSLLSIVAEEAPGGSRSLTTSLPGGGGPDPWVR